jgi:hypothetical protein
MAVPNTAESLPETPAPSGWRMAAALATTAAAVLISLVVVHWGWRWLEPSPAAMPAPELPERLAPLIVATPLFGRAEGAPGAPATAGSAETIPPAANRLPGEARLLGVLAARDGGGYALFRVPDRGPVLVAPGNTISEGVTLVAVQADRVRIRSKGVERELLLRPASAPGAAPAAAPPRAASAAAVPAASAASAAGASQRAACAVPPGFAGPVYRLNAELLTGIASQPDSWTALLSPASGGLAVRDQSGFASMLGLRPGDRITQANGIALAGVDDVLVAFVKPLIANQTVHVVGRRDGRRAEWLFQNAGAACP